MKIGGRWREVGGGDEVYYMSRLFIVLRVVGEMPLPKR